MSKKYMPYFTKSTKYYTKSFGDVIESYLKHVWELQDAPNTVLSNQQQREIRKALSHVVHQSFLTRKHSTIDHKKWCPIPLSNSHLAKKYPTLLVRSSRLGYTRGIDLLVEAKVLDRLRHSHVEHRCTMYKLNKKVHKDLVRTVVEATNEEYLAQPRGYSIEKSTKGQRYENMHDRIEAALEKGATRSKHDLSMLGRTQNSIYGRQPQAVVKRYRKALGSLSLVKINLDKLIISVHNARKQLKKNRTRKTMAHFQQLESFMGTLCKGMTLISEPDATTDRIVGYYPKYKVTPIGGRMFEVGTGIQNIKSEVKKYILADANWDFKSSQLNILKQELKDKGIKGSQINKISSVDNIARVLGIDRKLAKNVLYGTFFSAGNLVNNIHGSVFCALHNYYSYERVKKILRKWRIWAAPLIKCIKKIARVYVEEGASNQHGTSYKNVLGLRIMLDGSNKSQVARKVMAHVIQGIETNELLKLVEDTRNTVSGLEHDGLIGSIKRNLSSLEMDCLLVKTLVVVKPLKVIKSKVMALVSSLLLIVRGQRTNVRKALRMLRKLSYKPPI